MRRVDERQARAALCETARDIWVRGLGAAADGNLSVRLGPNRVLTTPSGCHKGRLRAPDLVVTDLSGAPVGAGRPSSELSLHLAAYRVRPDVGAVIHAHPPMATAYQLAGGKLSEVYVSEVIFAFGQVATAPYTTPTTASVGETLEPYLRCYDVVMMPRHGSVTLGADLDQAFVRLDAMEHTARVCATAQLLGAQFGTPPQPIAEGEVTRLYAAASLERPSASCPPMEPLAAPIEGADERLVQAVMAALSRGSPA